MFQSMYGCQWDDETGEVDGYDQYGYDGEDFIVYDLKTETWIAASPQAVFTKNNWENNKGYMTQNKYYTTQYCPDWLKKYVEYGRSSLLRTVLPSVSLLQKSPSSPVTCHATGFYPNRAMLFWRRDGEELHEDVEHGETLPNHDGTFQMSSELRLSSVSPEDWGKYECVFQLSGVEEDLVTRLDPEKILSNRVKPLDSTTTIIIISIIFIIFMVLAVVGFLVYRRVKKDKPSPPSVSSSEEQQLKGDSEETPTS